ncbi:MAG: hypothetical protein K0Q49_1224 [Haloplasmataceae bacterium]|jgi:4-azaleucine resistance transporter AzlC|nr:hypothetical protein [Haloplasmataceae bacterium]
MKNHFLKGIKAGIPIAIGYIPIAITFGLLAESYNIPNHISIMMSLLVFAGASQFVAINLIISGVSPFEIILTTFIVNFRHFLMSASLSQRLDKVSNKILPFLAVGVTDEAFSLSALEKKQKINPSYLLGLGLIGYAAWNIGTMIGLLLALSIPQIIQDSMGIALYAMFIGILVPNIKNSKPIFIIVLIAITISLIINYSLHLSSGWTIIITTIIASFIGAIIYPKERDING